MTQWLSRCDDNLHTTPFVIKQSWVSNTWLSMGHKKPCKTLERPLVDVPTLCRHELCNVTNAVHVQWHIAQSQAS